MNYLSPSVDHIDPINSDHICGLDCELNRIMKTVSYNAAKSNKFVPYRVELFGAPQEFGDIAEFLIEEKWVVCEFGGEVWHAETRRIGCGSTKNRVSETNPELHREISSLGGKALVKAGYHYGANGCHSSDNQRNRVVGKVWWYNPETGKETRSFECPGEGYKEGRDPTSLGKFTQRARGTKWYYNPETGQSRQLSEKPEGWIRGRGG